MIKNYLRLCQEKFRLDIQKNFFTKRVAKHWNRLSRGVVVSPILEVFERYVDMALSNIVYLIVLGLGWI